MPARAGKSMSEVADILSKRRISKSRPEQYRVRWVGSTEKDDTYEPCDALLSAGSRTAARQFEEEIRPNQQPGSLIGVKHALVCYTAHARPTQ
jgi:hypothetical protein